MRFAYLFFSRWWIEKLPLKNQILIAPRSDVGAISAYAYAYAYATRPNGRVA